MAQKSALSIGVYILLIVILAVLGAVNAFLPQGTFATMPANQELPAKPVMALVTAGTMLTVYGGLGFLGLCLSQRLGFANLCDPGISNRQRFLTPACAGVGLGVFFIIADALLNRLHAFGPLAHPPFPTSIIASAIAGIGEEVVSRLFFVPFWMWLVSTVIAKGRWQNEIFWIVAGFSALAFAIAHLPSVMFALGINSVDQVPTALMVEVVLLNGTLSLLAAHYFRRYGFLAAVGVHFWTDVIWHVIWGAFA